MFAWNTTTVKCTITFLMVVLDVRDISRKKIKTSLMTHAFSKINMITLSNQRFLFTLEMMMKCLSTSFTRIKSHENLWSFFAYQRHCSIFSLKYSFYLSSKKRNQLFMENSIVMANNDNTWFSFFVLLSNLP